MILLAVIAAITDPVQFLTASYRTVEAIIRAVCFRNRLKAEELEEFAAEVKLRLVENDYRILRVFTGRSSIETYLTTVIANTVRDLIRKRDGRWRPSEEAKRLGEVAERLEELIYRFHYPFHEAREILATNFGITSNERELRDIFIRLKARHDRPVAVDATEELMDERGTPEAQLAAAEQHRLEGRLEAIIAGMQESLSPADRLLLRLVYEDNVKLTVAAEQLRLTRAEADRRLKEILNEFRKGILAQGINQRDVTEFLGELG